MPAGVSVGTLVGLRDEASGLSLDVLAGAAGLERRITIPFIQKIGLALAGFDEYLRPGRVLVFGESEVRFLERMEAEVRRETLAKVFARDLPCVMLTLGLEPPTELVTLAEEAAIPLLRSDLTTAVAMARMTTLLEDRLAPSEVRHGVLVDVLGLGNRRSESSRGANHFGYVGCGWTSRRPTIRSACSAPSGLGSYSFLLPPPHRPAP